MSPQSNDQSTTTGGNNRVPDHLGDGEVHGAEHDPDVARMVSAEVDERAAAIHGMVAEAAYFRAEKRGFSAGHELEDWLAAERDVEQQMQQQESAARPS